MDLESIYRWEDYSRAKDEMMAHTDTPASPWYVVESDIKKHARLNMMSHLLSTIDYHDVDKPHVKLPDRPGAVAGPTSARPANCRPTSTTTSPPCSGIARSPAHGATLASCGSTSRRPWPCCSSSSPTGRCTPVNGTAFAVTPTLREAYAEGDDDELAEVALREAALASLRLLAGPATADGRIGLAAAAGGAGRRGRRRRRPRPDLDDAVVRLAGRSRSTT